VIHRAASQHLQRSEPTISWYFDQVQQRLGLPGDHNSAIVFHGRT
jgi:hypothetical protein